LIGAAAVALAVWGAPRWLDRVRRKAASPSQAVAVPLAGAVRGSSPVPDESAQLRAQVLELRVENERLQSELDVERRKNGEVVFPHQRLAKLKPCALLLRDPAVWFKNFSVDLGYAQGLSPEAGVLNAQGVVGKLVQVGESVSQVQLLSDPNCRLAARLPRTGLQCALAGDGRHGCLLQHLGGEDDVRAGDLVETGPGGRSFPPGVPVGRVIRIARLEGGLRLQVEVEPSAALEKLEGLYVWTGDAAP
jgi:rod shape-determining protein MreC